MSHMKSNSKANTIEVQNRKKSEIDNKKREQNENLKCPICKEMFDLEEKLPLMLNCGHIVCKYCVTESLSKEKKKLCPVDRKMEYTKCEKFQLFTDMLEKQIKKFVCKFHTNEKIEYYCEVCDKYFCTGCIKDHTGEPHKIHYFLPDNSVFEELKFLNPRITEKKINLNDELKKIEECHLLLISKNKENLNQIEFYITDIIDNLTKFKNDYKEKLQSFYKNQFEIIEKGSIDIHNEFSILEDIESDLNYLDGIKHNNNLVYENILDKKNLIFQKWEQQLKNSSRRDTKLISKLSFPVLSFQSFNSIEPSLIKNQIEYFEKKEENFPNFIIYEENTRKVNSEKKNQSSSSLDSGGKRGSSGEKRCGGSSGKRGGCWTQRKGSEPTAEDENKRIEIELLQGQKKPIIVTERPTKLFLPSNNICNIRKNLESKGNSFRQQNTLTINTTIDLNKGHTNKGKKSLLSS